MWRRRSTRRSTTLTTSSATPSILQNADWWIQVCHFTSRQLRVPTLSNERALRRKHMRHFIREKCDKSKKLILWMRNITKCSKHLWKDSSVISKTSLSNTNLQECVRGQWRRQRQRRARRIQWYLGRIRMINCLSIIIVLTSICYVRKFNNHVAPQIRQRFTLISFWTKTKIIFRWECFTYSDDDTHRKSDSVMESFDRWAKVTHIMSKWRFSQNFIMG